MRWLWILVVVVLVIGAAAGGLWHVSLLEKREALAEECVGSQSSLFFFVQAMKERNVKLCNQAEGVWKSRCKAGIMRDGDLCGEYDVECAALAGGNASLCRDPVCQALVTRKVSFCDKTSEDSREWCRHLAALDSSYFAPNETRCMAIAEAVS